MFLSVARRGFRVRVPCAPSDAAAAGRSPGRVCKNCETWLLATAQDDVEIAETGLAGGQAGGRLCRIRHLAAGTCGEIKFGAVCKTYEIIKMNFRRATSNDCALLAELNHQLIRDEGHRNKMTVPELEQRMKNWLASEYVALLFEQNGEIVAYALYREQPEEIYLRQFFVLKNRRRQGIGRELVEHLRTNFWPRNKRLTLEVLVENKAAISFWRVVGYKDYSLAMEASPETSS